MSAARSITLAAAAVVHPFAVTVNIDHGSVAADRKLLVYDCQMQYSRSTGRARVRAPAVSLFITV